MTRKFSRGFRSPSVFKKQGVSLKNFFGAIWKIVFKGVGLKKFFWVYFWFPKRRGGSSGKSRCGSQSVKECGFPCVAQGVVPRQCFKHFFHLMRPFNKLSVEHVLSILSIEDFPREIEVSPHTDMEMVSPAHRRGRRPVEAHIPRIMPGRVERNRAGLPPQQR